MHICNINAIVPVLYTCLHAPTSALHVQTNTSFFFSTCILTTAVHVSSSLLSLVCVAEAREKNLAYNCECISNIAGTITMTCICTVSFTAVNSLLDQPSKFQRKW
jgi:hypothetical protein